MARSREEYNAYMNAYMKRRWEKRRAAIVEGLGGKCAECGSIEDLEIDHVDPEKKTMTVARMSSASEERLLDELELCQLLCQPCHLKKSRAEGSLGDKDRVTVCGCGKRFETIKAYAGHKRWCEHEKSRMESDRPTSLV